MAARIHGLTNQDVADAPALADIEAEVRRALDADVLVAHNAHVDTGVLRRHLGGWQCPEVFDTLKLARRLEPGRESYKLGALATTFALAEGLPAGLTPHRASYDALVTARLFIHLATRQYTGPLSLGELRGNEAEETVMSVPFLVTSAAYSSAWMVRVAPGSPPSSPTLPRCSWPQANRCTSPPNHRMARSGCCAAS